MEGHPARDAAPPSGFSPSVRRETQVPVEMNSFLPDINFLRGGVYVALRKRFKDRVHRNDRDLQQAFINRHSWPHMDTVANGVYQLGVRMDGVAFRDLMAVTLATRFHDIGYDFQPGINPELLTKEQHCQHAQNGADLFVDAVNDLRSTPVFAAELAEWTDHHSQLAHDAIRLHSNGSTTGEQQLSRRKNRGLTLLPRLVDKLDNSADRISEAHLRLFSYVPHKTLRHIHSCVRQGARWALSEPTQFRHGSCKEDTLEKLEVFEYGFAHRLVPYAITSQRMVLLPGTGQVEMQYAAHPTQVENLLGISYLPSDHSAHFDLAYQKSMQNAAAVVAAIRLQLFGPNVNSDTPPLRVSLMYPETVIVKEYDGLRQKKEAAATA